MSRITQLLVTVPLGSAPVRKRGGSVEHLSTVEDVNKLLAMGWTVAYPPVVAPVTDAKGHAQSVLSLVLQKPHEE